MKTSNPQPTPDKKVLSSTSPDRTRAAAPAERYDVVILGAGLAGCTLARHLELETDKTVLQLERRDPVPGPRQKVGESSVQVGGYYFSRVLDLEEHLWLNHFMKYNLRFYWPSQGHDNSCFENYSQAYIRNFSNIPSYQMDRNVLEEEIIRLNEESPRFRLEKGIRNLDPQVADDPQADHRVSFDDASGNRRQVAARWVIDTTGRNRVMAKQMGLKKDNTINHGAFFWWVDGLVDVDRLTHLGRSEIRKKKERRAQGHLPTWLATSHFCAEGLWFWVIPLQGKTSLGLVYDKTLVDFEPKDVLGVEKATSWVCEHFPCFARDLPQREVLDFGGYTDFSHDCDRTIHPSRWAITGEAGRFSDPLYSPGSDLIAIHNTLIVDAIGLDDDRELESACRLYEQLMRSVYQAYIPTYDTSYDALGDAEAFTLKYTWELTVYFAVYVFPFINDLFVDRSFAVGFLRQFARLGPINQSIQSYLSGYYRWKKEHLGTTPGPVFHDFMSLGPLAAAEKTFYEVGLPVAEAKKLLSKQVDQLEELARFIAAWVDSVVVDDPRLLTHHGHIQGIDPGRLSFDAEAIRGRWRAASEIHETHSWGFDPSVMDHFRQRPATPQTALPEARAAAVEAGS